jgi:hypothetical protein
MEKQEVEFLPYSHTEISETVKAAETVTIRDSITMTEVCGGPYAAITSCSVYPPLPEGLHLSSSCVITGKAREFCAPVWPPQKYTVTAKNTGGTAMTTVYIGVKAIAPTTCALSRPSSKFVVGEKIDGFFC